MGNENRHVLEESEKKTCEEMVLKGQELEKKRAQALLALHNGATRKTAAELSGLSFGQVKYLISAFQKKRMQLFQLTATDNDLPLEMKSERAEETVTKKNKSESTKKKKKRDEAKADKQDKGKKKKLKDRDKKKKKTKNGKDKSDSKKKSKSKK